MEGRDYFLRRRNGQSTQLPLCDLIGYFSPPKQRSQRRLQRRRCQIGVSPRHLPMAQGLKKRSRTGQRPFLHDLAHRPRASFRPERAFPQPARWARVVDQSSRCSMDLERVAHARATLRRSNDVALADASTAAPRPARAALRAGSSRHGTAALYHPSDTDRSAGGLGMQGAHTDGRLPS